jgi:hypothetical protein
MIVEKHEVKNKDWIYMTSGFDTLYIPVDSITSVTTHMVMASLMIKVSCSCCGPMMFEGTHEDMKKIMKIIKNE